MKSPQPRSQPQPQPQYQLQANDMLDVDPHAAPPRTRVLSQP